MRHIVHYCAYFRLALQWRDGAEGRLSPVGQAGRLPRHVELKLPAQRLRVGTTHERPVDSACSSPGPPNSGTDLAQCSPAHEARVRWDRFPRCHRSFALLLVGM